MTRGVRAGAAGALRVHVLQACCFAVLATAGGCGFLAGRAAGRIFWPGAAPEVIASPAAAPGETPAPILRFLPRSERPLQ